MLLLLPNLFWDFQNVQQYTAVNTKKEIIIWDEDKQNQGQKWSRWIIFPADLERKLIVQLTSEQ